MTKLDEFADRNRFNGIGHAAKIGKLDQHNIIVQFIHDGANLAFGEVTEKRSIQIVDSESNPKMNILNENTPVALALLGLSQGETGQLEVPGHPARALRVLKIHRNDEETA